MRSRRRYMPLTFSAGSSTVCSDLRVASDVFRLSFVPVSPAFRPFTPVSPAMRSFLPVSLPALRPYSVPIIKRARQVQLECVSKRGERTIRTRTILTRLCVRNLWGGFCLFIYNTYAKYTRLQGGGRECCGHRMTHQGSHPPRWTRL
jgi:hypothetical protein